MKQMTEESLRDLLEKAFDEGSEMTLDEERGGPLSDAKTWDAKRNEKIQTLIDSL